MTESSQVVRKSQADEMSLEKAEEIRSALAQGKGRLVLNQQILFKYAAALPPGKRAGVYVAGWGPVVLFPFAPILYFYDWKIALFVIFLCIFWVGMGRKYAQAAILRQCHQDGTFLKFALSVGLVELV